MLTSGLPHTFGPMLLDLERIRTATVHSSPYPYFVVPGALSSDGAAQVGGLFPRIARPGPLAVDKIDYDPRFGRLLDELRSNEFRQIISEKFDIALAGKDIAISLRGQSRLTDGNIHTDTPAKLITILLYFNQPGEPAEAAGLRIFRSPKTIDDYIEEVPPLLGNLVAFRVTPNCWHGHRPFVGKRRSLQMNYLSGLPKTGRHQFFRRLWSHAGRHVGAIAGRFT